MTWEDLETRAPRDAALADRSDRVAYAPTRGCAARHPDRRDRRCPARDRRRGRRVRGEPCPSASPAPSATTPGSSGGQAAQLRMVGRPLPRRVVRVTAASRARMAGTVRTAPAAPAISRASRHRPPRRPRPSRRRTAGGRSDRPPASSCHGPATVAGPPRPGPRTSRNPATGPDGGPMSRRRMATIRRRIGAAPSISIARRRPSPSSDATEVCGRSATPRPWPTICFAASICRAP